MKIVNFLAMGVMLNVAGVFLSGCPNSPKPITTPVGLSVATLGENDGLCGPLRTTAIRQCRLRQMRRVNGTHKRQWARRPLSLVFRFWRNTTDGCLDLARTSIAHWRPSNMASVSNLKGLVQTATLTVKSQAIPSGVGAPGCPAMTAGAGRLRVRTGRRLGRFLRCPVGSFERDSSSSIVSDSQAVSVTPTPSGTGRLPCSLRT